jgi:hypothetical protein
MLPHLKYVTLCVLVNNLKRQKTKQKMNKHELWFGLNNKCILITKQHMDPLEFSDKNSKTL